MVENVPLEIRINMYFQHDGAPAHASRNVQNLLSITFPNRWIGHGRSWNWPARSPNLTPLDFFFGDILKIMYIVSLYKSLATKW